MTPSSSAGLSRASQATGSRAPGSDLPGGRDPETPEEAAKQFEKILVRQFVEVMTKDMFSTSLTGEGGPGWMKSQRGTQRDMMTDMLTDHLVDGGALQISEQLTDDWGASGSTPANPVIEQPVDPLPASPSDAPSSDERPRFDRAA